MCINVPTLIGFATTKLTWGAYLPGGTPQVHGLVAGLGWRCIVHAVCTCTCWLLCATAVGPAVTLLLARCCVTHSANDLQPRCLQDIGSGNCAVHNTLLLDHVQKSVLRAPWRFHPMPFWCGGRA